MDDDTCRAILAALDDLSLDIKAAAASVESADMRRGLHAADQLLHNRARAYAAGLVPAADLSPPPDELSAARERRDQEGLPVVATSVDDAGMVVLDFNLEGPGGSRKK